eukprot:5340328-Amphidinium_carterae.1
MRDGSKLGGVGWLLRLSSDLWPLLRAVYAQTPVSVRQAVHCTLCNVASWRVLVICVSVSMGEGRKCTFSETEAALLRESGSFWPGSMLDKDIFMELLASVLKLDWYQTPEWEKRLAATGALGEAGK